MNYNRNLFRQINRLTNEVTGSYRTYNPPEPPVVTDTVTITTEPTDITCYIGDTATLTIVAVSDDETATLSYQWQILDGETWLNVSGATESSYVVPTSGLKEDSYRCQVTSDKGGSATSTTATVTVQEMPVDTVTITTQPQTTTGYIGDTITLSVVAESDDETATLSYQWQRKDGSTYEDITDATSSTYTVNTAYTGTERYRVIVTSDKGGTATSNYADVTVQNDTVTISAQPQTTSGYVGDTITLSVTASSNNPNATLSYQWQNYGDGWTDISGATSNTYTVDTSTVSTRQYRCLINSTTGGTATSDSAIITIAVKPVLGFVYFVDNSSYTPPDVISLSDVNLKGYYATFMKNDIDYIDANKKVTGGTDIFMSGFDTSSAILGCVFQRDTGDINITHATSTGAGTTDAYSNVHYKIQSRSSTTSSNKNRIRVEFSQNGSSITLPLSTDYFNASTNILSYTNPTSTINVGDTYTYNAKASNNLSASSSTYRWTYIKVYILDSNFNIVASNTYEDNYTWLSGASNQKSVIVDTSALPTGTYGIASIVYSSADATALGSHGHMTVGTSGLLTIQ